VRVHECWHSQAISLYNIHACLHTASLISWVFQSWVFQESNSPSTQRVADLVADVADLFLIEGAHLLSATLSRSSWPRTVTPKMTDQHQQPHSLLNNVVSLDSSSGTSSTLTHGSCKTLKIGMACAQGTCLSSGWHSHGVLSCMAQERVAFMQRQSTFSQTISFGKYLPPVYPTLMLMGTPLNV